MRDYPPEPFGVFRYSSQSSKIGAEENSNHEGEQHLLGGHHGTAHFEIKFPDQTKAHQGHGRESGKLAATFPSNSHHCYQKKELLSL